MNSHRSRLPFVIYAARTKQSEKWLPGLIFFPHYSRHPISPSTRNEVLNKYRTVQKNTMCLLWPCVYPRSLVKLQPCPWSPACWGRWPYWIAPLWRWCRSTQGSPKYWNTTHTHWEIVGRSIAAFIVPLNWWSEWGPVRGKEHREQVIKAGLGL